MPRRVFISHSSENAAEATALCEGLEARGLTCWMAPRDVVGHESSYGPEIEAGIAECPVFLLLLTRASAQSGHVEREAALAVEGNKHIILIVSDRAEAGRRLSYYLAGRQRLHASGPPDATLIDRVYAAIDHRQEDPAPSPAPPPPPPSSRSSAIKAAAMVVAVLVVAYGAWTFRPRPGIGEPSPKTTPAKGPDTPAPIPGPASPTPSAKLPVPSGPPAVTSKPAAPIAAPPRANTAPAPPAPGGSVATFEGATLPFVAMARGSVMIGCDGDESTCDDAARPRRQVAIGPFQMSATEVTQAFWNAVLQSNPSDFDGPNQPVEHVSVPDIARLLERLNGRDGFVYRLPTEAEWEYAARAGESGPPSLERVAWFGLAANPSIPARPQAVGTKAPNRWGLYDMLGNVAEWCQADAAGGDSPVAKGGSWVDPASALNVSARRKVPPGTRDYAIGLRVVRLPLK